MEVVSIAGLRLDGRRPEEVRRVRCELGVLPNFDGSANVEQGNTKVAVTITGPCEATIRSKYVVVDRSCVILRCLFVYACLLVCLFVNSQQLCLDQDEVEPRNQDW
jgi:ribonuclease PH